MLSDDSTSDSDTGIRFKTDSTRRPATKEEHSLKNRKDADSKYRDSIKSYSSRRSPPRRRDRSPVREDRYKDRQKSDYEHHRSSFYDKDRGSKDGVSRDTNKYSSKGEERSRSDDKKLYDKESRSFSKSSRNDIEKKSDVISHESSKDKRSDIGCRLLQRSTKDDRQILYNSESYSKHSYKRDNDRNLSDYQCNGKLDSSNIRISDLKVEVNSESPKSCKRSIKKNRKDYDSNCEKRIKHDDKVENSTSPICTKFSDTSDFEEKKPVSYYNMVSSTYENDACEKNETIAVSDSSEDEATLQKQLLLLEHELKKTKSKKKSKHRDKRKLSKHQKNDSDDRNSQESYTVSTEDRSNCNESNEEGEIVSDSDEKLHRDDLRAKLGKKHSKKQDLPDLRDRLSLKTGTSERSSKLTDKLDELPESAEEVEGPALPPHMMKSSNSTKNIGPTLPDGMRKKLLENSEHNLNEEDIISSDDEDIYGPIPENLKKASISHRRLEERALKMKIDSLNDDKNEHQKDGREEWMLKLPDAKAKHLGLTSRQFRAREGPDLSDRSSWTDTPEEKALKAAGIDPDGEKFNSQKLLQNAELEFIHQRDVEQEMIVRKHKKKSKRKESLLDLHQKKLKKKKKKEDKEEMVRRPFSRDIDLKANRFDEAQKNVIIKKAQLLDTRFSRGESKFL